MTTAIITAVSSLGGAPMLLLLMEMFPASVRASGLSVIYGIGVARFGGIAQFIDARMISKAGNPLSLAIYMFVCRVVGFCAMASLP